MNPQNHSTAGPSSSQVSPSATRYADESGKTPGSRSIESALQNYIYTTHLGENTATPAVCPLHRPILWLLLLSWEPERGRWKAGKRRDDPEV